MSARSTFQSTILPITSVFAGIVTAFGVAMLAPLLLAFIARDPAQPAFLRSALLVFAPAVSVWLATRRFRRELRVRDGILLVTLIWTILPAIAAMPLLIGIPGLSFTGAYFESVSGLTTTGATVLSGLDQLPASLNLWRHLLHWFGGMGNIVLAVAILPLLGIGGMQLHRAETPGPMKDSKLTPRIAHTVKALWYVYAGLTLACALTLKLCGMSWFDAVCHAFSTLALGGFSTHDKSIGYFDSVPIELVLSFFQILAALNFATHFMVIRQRALKPYLRDSEAVALLKTLLLSVVGIAIFLQLKGTYPDFLVALRHASFNVITTATTGGFFSQDFNQWPLFAPMMMLFLSCIVASSGSTGGGLRMIRMLVLMKSAWREMLRILHPGLSMPVKISESVIENKVVMSVLAFVVVYFMSIVSLTLLLLASGLDLTSSISAVISCINSSGPGLGAIGPLSNYGVLSDFQQWVCTVAMLLGRLEVFTLVLVFTRAFWRK
jgi:trk system potassium uptake protein TrkH